MKRIILSILVMAAAHHSFAQVDYKKRIVDSTCSCLSAIPDLDKKSSEELQALIGQCMMEKSMGDFMDYAKEKNVDMSDMDGMQKLGMDIGVALAKSDCKVMTSLMLKMAQQGNDNTNSNTIKVNASPTSSLEGTVQKVEVKDYVYVNVLSDGKPVQLVWIENFSGSEPYIKNPQLLVNKKLSFSYVYMEIYDPKAKAYSNVKLIKGVE